MRVLLIGATGNLGSRAIPALLAHGHDVTAFVRSPEKLRGLVTPALYNLITVYKGDAFDSAQVENALVSHTCDAIVNTSGTREPPWRQQIMTKIITSITSAAIRVGKARAKPLTAWFIGGLGSLQYPGTGGWKIEDYMPSWITIHHRQTHDVLKGVSTKDLQWTLLCVAMMRPASTTIDVLEKPRRHGLIVSVGSPPDWQDGWMRSIPLIGRTLDLFSVVPSYSTILEDVADLIADELGQDARAGELVGFKDTSSKTLE